MGWAWLCVSVALKGVPSSASFPVPAACGRPLNVILYVDVRYIGNNFNLLNPKDRRGDLQVPMAHVP